MIEELRSANEEAQSANEELQSTNEEMQTSKEELQSSNEELNTINMEMQSRNVELKQMNDDLTNLLGSMNMPIVMTGRDLSIRRFTPSAAKALRLISTDVGRPIADLKPRIDVPDLEEILRGVLDSLQPYEKEVRDQEGRSYLMRVRPYRTADNHIDGTVLQLLDVTEHKRSLDEVKHARDYAEMIVNTVREPLAVLDEEATIHNANQAFLDIVERQPAAVLGKNLFEVARGRFDLPPIRALMRSLKVGMAEMNDVEIEFPQERGGSRSLVVNASRLRAPNQRNLILMAFEDITERKRAAEARYRRLFESARDGIFLVDSANGEILDLNPYAEQLLGYRCDELIGGKLWDIGPMQTVPGMRAAVEQIRDQGVLRFDDSVLRTKDGREVHVETIASVHTEENHRVIQFNMRDITERKRFERELQESQKLESLGLLAGGIAHDFNNLLTGILGNASLALAETAAEAPVRGRMRQIMDACERAAFLTRQMLAYAGKGRFVVSQIDLGEFIREISPLLRTAIPKSVELKLDLAPKLPLIEADTVQIQQVIANLVVNGAEAIGEAVPGRVTIRTSARQIGDTEAAEFSKGDQAAPGSYVQIEVIDTGQGMDETTKTRIFDPFFTTKFTGRGLGLAAVQGIVRAHRGAIRVYSTPEQGSTFSILIPAAGDAADPNRGPYADARRMPAGSVALVIEDEKTVRTLADSVLTRAGMKVMLAENGKRGVEIFREHHGEISMVILDLQMPVMGGEEALALLRQINPGVPVILSSGFEQSEAQRRFAALQPVHFLQKPYTAGRLAEAVAAALRAEAPDARSRS
ncbi:MAG: PAS domain S-box protein [Bryobacteraceae bacterium]